MALATTHPNKVSAICLAKARFPFLHLVFDGLASTATKKNQKRSHTVNGHPHSHTCQSFKGGFVFPDFQNNHSFVNPTAGCCFFVVIDFPMRRRLVGLRRHTLGDLHLNGADINTGCEWRVHPPAKSKPRFNMLQLKDSNDIQPGSFVVPICGASLTEIRCLHQLD